MAIGCDVYVVCERWFCATGAELAATLGSGLALLLWYGIRYRFARDRHGQGESFLECLISYAVSDTERVHHIGLLLVTAAMVPLALGMSADFFVAGAI